MRKVVLPNRYRTVPWKNGGGTTQEIVVEPAGADRFLYRASIADVRESGPFSSFPGYDRWITIVEGAGMTLRLPDGAVELRPLEPLRFDGDSAVSGVVDRGPVRDFNWIVDRARVASSTLSVRTLKAGETLVDSAKGGVAIVLCHQGKVRGIPTGSTLVVEDERFELEAMGEGATLVVGELRLP